MVLAALIESRPRGLTEPQVQGELTAVENTPERIKAITRAVDGLIEVGLVVRAGDRLQPTLASVRAGELELGL